MLPDLTIPPSGMELSLAKLCSELQPQGRQVLGYVNALDDRLDIQRAIIPA